MEQVSKIFTLLASIWLLLLCNRLPVSASYTKYVRVGDSLQLECISTFDDQLWTIIWLKATTYWRQSGKLLSKNDLLDDQNTDNRFRIKVHQITLTRKRFSLTIVNVKQSDDAVYWCVALPQHDNTEDIAAINKHGTDLTGDIYVTVEYPPGPEDPICLNETTAYNQVTLSCCHRFATPFPSRQLLLNGVKLKNTEQTRNGNLYCLTASVSAPEETYQCELSSAAFPDYKSTCEYNFEAPEPSVSNTLLPELVTEASYHTATDKPSTFPTPKIAYDMSSVWIAFVISSVISTLICIIGVCIWRRNKHDSYDSI